MQRHSGEVKRDDEGKTSVGDKTVPTGERWLRRLITIDVALSDKLAVGAAKHSSTKCMRQFLKILELSCHGVPWLVGTVIAVLLTHKPWLHEVLLNLFTALLFDLVVVFSIKLTVRRRRPEKNIMDMFATLSADKFSFPSGHATRAAMVTCFMFAFLPLSVLSGTVVLIWAVCVVISRVVLGRHHVSDIICGVVIGIVEYYVFTHFLWMSGEICESMIRPIQEEMHL